MPNEHSRRVTMVTWASPALSALSPIWAGINTLARPLLSRRAQDLPCPIISIGNVLAGGVGKTEIVNYIAQKFIKQGKRVAISMRGYGSTWENDGGVSDNLATSLKNSFPDEALLHLIKAPGVTVAVGSNRWQVLKDHWSAIKPDVILLDDGYQHFALKRDLDILVHDFSVRYPIYRDSLQALKNTELRFSFSDVPDGWKSLQWVVGRYEITGAKNQFHQLQSLPSTALVFCGIGNPQRLLESLNKKGVDVREFKVFPDHAQYDGARIAELNRWFQLSRAQHGDVTVLTTLKDYVKLMNKLPALSFDVKYIDLNLKITQNEDFFWSRINEALAIRKS